MSTEQALRARVGIEQGEVWPRYAWPGGYPLGYITDDGDFLCGRCMNDEVVCVHFDGDADGWRVDAVTTLEGGEESEWCAHCGSLIYDAGE